MRGRSYLIFAAVVVIWGFYYLGTEKLLESGWDPEWMNALRFLIGGTLVTGVALLRGAGEDLKRLYGRDFLRLIVLSGGFVFTGMWLLTHSQEILPSSVVGVLAAVIPLWTALLATRKFFGSWRLSSFGWLGIALGALGVVVIYAPWSVVWSELGIAFVLLGALFLAGEGLFIFRWFQGVNPLALAGAIGTSTGLFFLITALPGEWSSGSWTLLILMALGSNGIAYLGYFWLVVNRGATFASLYSYLLPPYALIAGVLLGGDTFSFGLLIGCCLAVVGAFLASRGGSRRKEDL
jgi:drug/metabolite transporter (DMT)-like permease